MRTPQIFISYRRDDAAGYARAVYDELARQFGAERVFIDVDDIVAGQIFDDVIQRAVGQSLVLLVLIGKRWRGERDGALARINEPGDLVRQEVAAALARGMRVIPLLLDDAAMPTEAQLPDDLRALAKRNALELGNARFASDMERLVAALRDTLGTPAPAPPAPPRVLRTWIIAGAALVAIALGTLWQLHGSGPRDGIDALAPTAAGAAPSAAVAARPEVNGAWQADVTYDWPNAHHVERFEFAGEGSELHGSASFLGVARGVLDASLEAGGLRFVTRTRELSGDGSAQTVHRYRGRLADGELHVVMQTEGGATEHVPVEFVARRVAPNPASAPAR